MKLLSVLLVCFATAHAAVTVICKFEYVANIGDMKWPAQNRHADLAKDNRSFLPILHCPKYGSFLKIRSRGVAYTAYKRYRPATDFPRNLLGATMPESKQPRSLRRVAVYCAKQGPLAPELAKGR
ncbi:uncharacterized protein RAG0_07457 [Rhynchosporium agropyri]|uniref:Uncharacterized protein n=1 Tax=Rhynchosporium agropyri TaxID=914238 RepID=A0A1E1KLI4_9HELO|nr:uncharacterized protein RAG0_07457 [Rhynchosporium agropyri]